MPASRPGGLQHLPTPPHSRSRGGHNAGSSDRPGRRNPHTADSTPPRAPHQTSRTGPSSTPSALPPEFIRAVKRLLERQRDFRVGQLSELGSAIPDLKSDPARIEVSRRLLTAARGALADVDAAIDRIEHGRFGRCRACGAVLLHARLAALPVTARCSGCQRALDESTRDPRPEPAGECTMFRTNR